MCVCVCVCVISVVKELLVRLDGLNLLADFERGAKSKFHRHEQVVVTN